MIKNCIHPQYVKCFSHFNATFCYSIAILYSIDGFFNCRVIVNVLKGGLNRFPTEGPGKCTADQ